MASVKKRPSGKWRARYRGPEGHERARHFDRKVDAERWLATQQADVARGAWVDPALGRMTFGEWADRWQAGLTGLRPTTEALNLGVLRNHLRPRFGSRPLSMIGTSDVKAMVSDDLMSERYSSSAIRRHVIVLRVILGAAVDEGRLGRNPCAGVKLPPESTRPMRFCEPAEVVALADAPRLDWHRPLVLTAAYVGLRWGELAGLGIEHVDPLRRTIRVERQLVEVNGRIHFGPPKTKAGNRTVTMPAAIAELLGEHMAAPAVRSSGLVFPTITGLPMRRSNFRTRWRLTIDGQEAKGRRKVVHGLFPEGHPLAGLVFHELRHTAAALAISQGAHPLAIRDRLGHSSITVTMDTYGGLFPSLDEAIAEGLDGVLRASLAQDAADRLRTAPAQVVRLPRSTA